MKAGLKPENYQNKCYKVLAMKHIPYLDGWRGIAILLVLANHFLDTESTGLLGVNLFFVLSGLLMTRILFEEEMPIATFYKRRIARIFPVFYLYLCSVALIASMLGTRIADGDFLYSFFFLRTYFPGTNIWAMQIPYNHLWSLYIEEHAYLILSLIAIASRAWSASLARYATTLCALACIGFYGYYKYHPPASQSPVDSRTECGGLAIMASASIFLWKRHLKLNFPRWVSFRRCLPEVFSACSLPWDS